MEGGHGGGAGQGGPRQPARQRQQLLECGDPPGRDQQDAAARPAAARPAATVASPRPFLKWAGGKRRLLPEISAAFPERFGRYFEPFLGGGAVMLHVLHAHPGTACIASDADHDLVAAYGAIRDDVEGIIELLRAHAERFASDGGGGGDYYYRVRAESPSGVAERAARLLFLNRTCFNGLYRTNKSGKFNVPFGGYKNPNIVNAAVLRAASDLLLSARPSIECRDFEAAVGGAERGDLVYMDPPYQPTSPTSFFTHYTRRDFGGGDLERLAAACRALDERGCRVVLSNSDAPEVRRLFAAAGGRWRYRRLSVRRAINSDGAKRSGHSELLIRNY